MESKDLFEEVREITEEAECKTSLGDNNINNEA